MGSGIAARSRKQTENNSLRCLSVALEQTPAPGLPLVSCIKPLAFQDGIRVRTFSLAYQSQGGFVKQDHNPADTTTCRDKHSRSFEPRLAFSLSFPLCKAKRIPAKHTQALAAALAGVTTQRKNDCTLGRIKYLLVSPVVLP